jgi:hypothetical protein
MPPIYIDLDQTLSYPVYTDEKKSKVDHFVFRPGALPFLEALSRHGELRILTMSEGGWAQRALRERPDLEAMFSMIITMEDMGDVESRLKDIFSLAGLSDGEKLDLVGMVKPISEPGIAFDDQAYGSSAWYLKSVSIGTFDLGPDLWIKVDPFSATHPDRSGLERAFHRFKARNSRWTGRGAGLGRKGLELAERPGYTPPVTLTPREIK